MNKTTLRAAAALLLFAFLLSFISCGDKPAETAPVNPETTAVPVETEPADPLASYDLGGDVIRIYTSVDATDATNANALIEGSGEENGEVVNDAVYKRNLDVSELLNINYEFTHANEDYFSVQPAIQKIVLAGDDVYDLIVNDIYPLANLALEGMFRDVSQNPVFDFEAGYWRQEYMKDLSVVGETQFIMAGDYFMDVLCSAHALYFNKQLIENIKGDPDYVYKKVLDGEWTTDAFLGVSSAGYQDLNGDTKRNRGDIWGFSCIGMWGAAVPFMLCGDLEFVSRDESGGVTGYALNNERAAKALSVMKDIFYDDATYPDFTDIPSMVSNFASGLSVFVGYQRVGDFDSYRDTEFDIGIAPYPKLGAEQERYVTATHDTTEIGVIPITSSKYDSACVAVEALCRETERTVLPAYYETALKIKYARDDITSQMLDIIRGNIRVSFPTAYNGYMNSDFLYNVFSVPLSGGSADFASNMAKIEARAEATIEKMIEQMESIGD